MDGLIIERVVEAEFTEADLRLLRAAVLFTRRHVRDDRLSRMEHLLRLRIEECDRGPDTVWRIE